MTYLIRSMSTTDYAPQYGQYPQPYHLYLMHESERRGAFWSRCAKFQEFATPQEATEYGYKVLGPGSHFQVVPKDDRSMPTYWDLQDMNVPHWQTHRDGRSYLLPEDPKRIVSDEEAKVMCERMMEWRRKDEERKAARA